MIRDIKLLNYRNANEFFCELNKEVDKLQLEGYKVEVQYSKDGVYSALLIAREK